MFLRCGNLVNPFSNRHTCDNHLLQTYVFLCYKKFYSLEGQYTHFLPGLVLVGKKLFLIILFSLRPGFKGRGAKMP